MLALVRQLLEQCWSLTDRSLSKVAKLPTGSDWVRGLANQGCERLFEQRIVLLVWSGAGDRFMPWFAKAMENSVADDVRSPRLGAFRLADLRRRVSPRLATNAATLRMSALEMRTYVDSQQTQQAANVRLGKADLRRLVTNAATLVMSALERWTYSRCSIPLIPQRFSTILR